MSFPISAILVFGEEYGWRYYFQPLLQKKFGLIKGVLFLGVLWGLWHVPLDLFYFQPEAPMFGIVGHQIVCISLGIFMAYVYMKTNNVWLPAMIHYLYNYSGTFIELNYTWGLVGLFALLFFIFFWPFLFSKVFGKPKANCDRAAVEEPALTREADE